MSTAIQNSSSRRFTYRPRTEKSSGSRSEIAKPLCPPLLSTTADYRLLLLLLQGGYFKNLLLDNSRGIQRKNWRVTCGTTGAPILDFFLKAETPLPLVSGVMLRAVVVGCVYGPRVWCHPGRRGLSGLLGRSSCRRLPPRSRCIVLLLVAGFAGCRWSIQCRRRREVWRRFVRAAGL